MPGPGTGEGTAFDAEGVSVDGDPAELRRVAEGQVIGYETQLAEAHDGLVALAGALEKAQAHVTGRELAIENLRAEITTIESALAEARAALEGA